MKQAKELSSSKKIVYLKSKYPEYQFVGINLDKNQADWNIALSKYKFDGSGELRSNDFEDIKSKWAIMKVHRAIVLNGDGKIKTAFTNIFNVDFEKNL